MTTTTFKRTTNKSTQVTGNTKTCGASKLKIYLENGQNSIVSSLQTSLSSSNNGIIMPKNIGLKKDVASGAGDVKCSQNTLGKTKVGRKALADVSNLRGTSSRFDKPCRSRNSITSATLVSTAFSSQSVTVKVKPIISHGVTISRNSVKASSTKATRTSSNFDKTQAQNVENKPRKISRSSNTFTRLYAQRKSFPALKRPSQFGANKSQGDVTNLAKTTQKLGFPLKNRTGGKVVPQVSNNKGKVLKDRMSNIVTVSRNQTSKDVPKRLGKSIKPVVRSSSQVFNAGKNSKSNCISSLNESLFTISGREAKVAESSIPKPLKSIESHEEVSEGAFPADNGNVVAETTADKRFNRRKSFTSLLISKSKSLIKKYEVMEPEKLSNIDDKDNPLEVAEYVDDIYQYYWLMEAQSASLENYMMNQTDITPQMRGILINWLIEVHFKFDLMPETLYLTVALLDRYLSLVPINKIEMQLVGLASLLLASKYEDFWHPRVKDLISISAESYTRKQMLDMEKVILRKLKFRLNLPTAYVFMLRFLKASQSDEQLEHLAFYLIELCLVDYEALKFRPSLLCASAVYVARCTLHKVPAWTPLLSKHAHYEESQIRDCAEMICQLHKAARTGLLKVTYDKYKKREFSGVTAIKPLDALPL